MIYELRTYTLRPGTVPEVVKAADEYARPIRGDDYGKLEGYWYTDIGPLNQVMHLWSYADLNERQSLRAKLAENEAWMTEYIPKILPHLLRQELRLMNAVLPPKAPEAEGNVYEFRNYRVQVAKAREWARLASEALPARERYSKNVGLWIVEVPDPNEVCHLWAYADLNARAEARAAAGADSDWQTFLAKASPLLEVMHSTVLLPAPHSPLK